MIKVIVDQTGDWGWAEDENGALVAAKTLCREAYDARCGTIKPTVTFMDVDHEDDDGVVIRRSVPEAQLWTIG